MPSLLVLCVCSLQYADVLNIFTLSVANAITAAPYCSTNFSNDRCCMQSAANIIPVHEGTLLEEHSAHNRSCTASAE
jgi:hypothetical protein